MELPGLKTIRIAACDMNGQMRGKRLPASQADKLDSGGARMPVSALNVDLWGRDVEDSPLVFETGDADGVMLPTERGPVPMPWLKTGSALVPMAMYWEDGSAFLGDPRHVLADVLSRYTARGWTVVAATEMEFSLLDDSGAHPAPPIDPLTGRELDQQSVLSIAELDAFDEFFSDLYDGAEAMGIPAQDAISEAGLGQFEINLHHQEAMRAADDAWLFKALVKGLARKHGFAATFMAKPYAEEAGNGMHVHVSMEDDNGNLFADSETGADRLGYAINGLLKTMPEALLLFISTFNGFRRMQPGSYAPASICWGYDNRSVALRVPASSPEAARVEHRIGGADANPYLVLTGVLAGMLEGLKAEKAPPKPVTGNAYEKKHKRLTPWMDEAIDAFEASDRMKEAVGPEMHKVLTEIKKEELNEFGREISSLERQTYL